MPATLAGATHGKKAAQGASTSPAHFIPRDITGNAWRSRSALSCAKCAPSEPWLALSLPDAGTSSSRLQREAALPEHRGHPGPPSVAAPSWHACAVVRTVRGQSDMSTAERTPHTDSSVDSSKGLMYSKPSNSDWSILLMTSLWAQAEGTATGRPATPPTQPAAHGGGVLGGGPQGLLVVGGQLHGLAGELRVEVVQPVVVGDLRLERGQRLLLLQLRRQRTRRARQPASCPLMASVPAHSSHTQQKVLTFTHALRTRRESPSSQTPADPYPGPTQREGGRVDTKVTQPTPACSPPTPASASWGPGRSGRQY